ncbi:MAG: hypothetical protein ABW215_00305 [Kibdelosporangium sp.]
MRTLASPRTLTWLLGGQIALTVAAFAVLGVAFATSATGMMLSSGILLQGVLLIVGGSMGIVAVRSPVWRVRAAIVLLAPAVLVLASALSPVGPAVGQDGLPDELWQPLQHTLAVLTWAHWLAFAGTVLSTVAGLVVLTAGRRAA